MQADFDMNSNDILNVDKLYINGLYIDGQPVSAGTLNYNGVIKETQTATSGQTVFNLNTMVYNPGINSLSVYVDGVYQNPSTYTENNSTRITFFTGLHVGAIVDFVALSINEITGAADASSVTYTPNGQSLYGASTTVKSALDQISNEGTGSSKVGFLQSGTGATNRTVQAKLRDSISVLDFGADPTGATDSTTAIQAAINSISTTLSSLGRASGTEIFFPTGTYLISSSLIVDQKNVLFSGNNSIVQYTGSSVAFLIGNAAYLTDPTIGYYTAGFSRLYITLTNSSATGIRNNGYRNLSISYCYVRGGAVGFETEGCFGGCLVQNTFFQLQTTYGIHLKQANNLTQIRNGACLSGMDAGVRISTAGSENQDITFINWDVEGADIGYLLDGNGVGPIRMINCRAESNVTHSIKVDNTLSGLFQNIDITGGWFDKPIEIGVSGGLGLVRGCYLNAFEMSNANLIVNSTTGVALGNEIILAGTSTLVLSSQALATSQFVTTSQFMPRYQVGAGTPFGVSDTRGIIGDLRWDGTFAYIKNANNSWGRTQIEKFAPNTIISLPTGVNPDVSGYSIVKTANVGATTITNLTGGVSGQEIVIVGRDGGNTTFNNSANLLLPGGANITLGDNDVLRLVCWQDTSSLWVCSGYTNN
jgi:hypothetical protein